MRAQLIKSPPHLTPIISKLDAQERQRYYLEEVAPYYQRDEKQCRRLPHYIIRCEAELSVLTQSHQGQSYILGFNTLKSLLDYLAVCYAGIAPPPKIFHQESQLVHLDRISLVYQEVMSLRLGGDETVNLEELVTLINTLLAGSCYLNIIDLKNVCEGDLEESRLEREGLRIHLQSRRLGDHPLSRRERIAYLQAYYPEVLPPEVS